jgi:oxygen-dependent protoporphyrinogen oxidase
MERDHGGLIRAAWHRTAPDQRRLFDEDTGARFGTFVTLAEGMETLPRALAATLPPQSIRLNSPARRISRNASATGWTVELLNGAAFEADAVIVTTEAHATARLFEATDPSLALQLRGIPYASSVILNMAYRREEIQHPLDGLGIFAPLIENRSFLATSFSSVKFPNRAPEGTVMLRTFIGGPMQAELCQLEDQALSDLVARDLGQLIGAKAPPLFQQISRHPRAMPQYVLGHLDSVEAIRKRIERHPGLFLTGIAFDGVGIPDCIRGAQKTASDVLNSLFNSSVAAA